MIDKDRHTFLKLSSELTGYSEIDLQGTGLVDEFWDLIVKQLGKDLTDLLISTAHTVINIHESKEREHAIMINILASPVIWPVCAAIITLWYRGQWTNMTPLWYKYYARKSPEPGVKPGATIVPSGKAYTQQLSYRAAGAHPPGAHPTGFGSWGLDPVFGDFVTSDKE